MGEQKKTNLGLSLIRVWLSFEVVADHYWHTKGLTGTMGFLFGMRSLAVPCFLWMSFYLTANRYETSDGGWLTTRLGRLGVPYLVWPLIYFSAVLAGAAFSPAFVSAAESLTELKVYGFKMTPDVWDLVRQYLCGMDRLLLHQFWFHNNMIIWTVVLFGLLKLVKKPSTRLYTLAGLTMAAFAIQYSPLNKGLFNPMSWEVKYSYGRLVATLPYAAIGILLGMNRGALSKITGSLRVFLSVTGLFLLFFVYYSKCLPRPSGMGYQGISLFVMAFGAVMFFHYLPLDHVSGVVGKAVDWVSRYCMGIYCSHLLVGYVLYAWVFPHVGVGLETFWACIWIWLASWLCCALIALIPGKFSKMLVQ